MSSSSLHSSAFTPAESERPAVDAAAYTGATVRRKGAPPTSGSPLLVDRANAGDHLRIQQLLQAILHGPTEAEFECVLERPDYDPSQRWVVRHGTDLLAHLRMEPRTLGVGAAQVASLDVTEVAVLPECRPRELRSALWQALACQARQRAVPLLTCDQARSCSGAGWVGYGARQLWVANPRQLLAAIQLQAAQVAAEGLPVVRPCRQVQQDALMRLYDQWLVGRVPGMRLRDESYWRWLLMRRGFDRIYVAMRSSANATAGDELSSWQAVDGYVVLRDSDVVELVADPARPIVALTLLARVARDAVERDRHVIRIFPPLEEVFSQLMRPEWSSPVAPDRQPAAWVLDHHLLVQQLLPEMHRQAQQAGLSNGRLTLLGDGLKPITVTVSKRAARCSSRASEHRIAGDATAVSALLLGMVDLDYALHAGRIQVSSETARQLAIALLPRHRWLRNTLDDLQALR